MLPIAVHAAWNWSPSDARRPSPLTPGLVEALREDVPEGAVVYSDLETSYRIAAFAPVYIAAAPPGHVADTEENRPYSARAANIAVLPRPATWRSRAGPARRWLVVDRSRFDVTPQRGQRLPRRPLHALSCCRSDGPVPSPGMKLLLVTLYFPPAGGGGVQRPLKFAQYLPALGIETHVLAPDDSKWIHEDADLRVPTQAWVHRARYLGPKGRRPAEELHGTEGLERALVQARLASRRLLVPDENVSWNLTAIPAAIRIARKEGIDVVLTTSPPNSVHFVGAAVKKATGAKWVADLRDSLVAHPHRRAESMAVRAKEKVDHGVARLVAHSADAITCVSDAIAEEARSFSPKGQGRDDLERLRLRRLRRARLHAGRALPDHAHRQLLRQARPAPVPDRARGVGARRPGALPRRLPLRRPRVGRGARASATSSS